MDGTGITPHAMPRLSTTRMARQISDEQRTPIAGPSRLGGSTLQLPSGGRGGASDDDSQSTPRVPVPPLHSFLQDQSAPAFPPSSPGGDGASDVSRLRAVLAKTKGTSRLDALSGARGGLRFPHPRSPSEPDSDFDLPSTSVAVSFAQESLKDLFSKFLPDTPQKHARRRSSLESIDADIPYGDRSKDKGKRKSLSDDEVEKSHKSEELVGEPVLPRSSAATLDKLRERLEQASSADSHSRSPPRSLDLDETPPQADLSQDSAATDVLLERLGPMSPSPPRSRVPSSPSRTHGPSVLIPSMQSQSNLMELDSDMDKMMDLDSFDSDSFQTKSAFQSSANGRASTPARPLPFPRSRTASIEKTAGKRPLSKHSSLPFIGSSPIGSPSQNGSHEQERGWGRPAVKASPRHSSPALDTRHSLTAAHLATHNNSLSRRGSISSLSGMSGKGSDVESVRSRTMSLASTAASDARGLERGWNQPNPRLRRQSSNLSLGSPLGSPHERVRRVSTPSKPSSPGLLSPWEGGSASPSPGYKRRSLNFEIDADGSVSGRSSRASVRSVDEEIVVERERNWNSPHPKWTHSRTNSSNSASGSPLPSKAAVEASPSPRVERVRAESMKTLRSPGSPGSSIPTAKQRIPLRQTHSTSVLSHDSQRRNGSSASLSSPAASRLPKRAVAFPFRHETPEPPHHASTPPLMHDDDAPAPRPVMSGWSFPSRSRLLPIESSPERGGAERDRQQSNDTVVPSDMEEGEDPVEASPDSTRPTTPAPGSRPSSRISVTNGSASRIPVYSPSKKDKVPPSPSKSKTLPSSLTANETGETVPTSPSRSRGHRRTVTEYSRAVGALRPGINDEYLKPSPSPTPPAVRINGVDQDALHVSDEDAELDETENTPRHLPLEISPQSSPQPSPRASPLAQPLDDLPPETIRSHSPISMEIETLEPHATPPETPSTPPHRADMSLPTPPPELPPSPPPAALLPAADIVSTPPRQTSMSVSLSEYQTPPPPKGGLPELPEPPSGEDDTVDFLRTPMRALNGHPGDRPDLSSMKTPKPPGAWTATPQPAERFEAPDRFEPEAMSTPPNRLGGPAPDASGESQISEGGLATPAPSLSRAASTAQTPAPPGGWFMTPGTEKRKALLKVRFDISESEASMVEDTLPELPTAAMIVPGALPKTPAPANATEVTHEEFDSIESSMADAPTFLAHPEPAAPLRLPSITEASSSRPGTTPRRQGGVRVVDAYGREQPPDLEPIGVEAPDTTARSRSAVRIVNAHGDVVEDVVEEESQSMIEDVPATREQALATLQSGVSELANDMDEHHSRPRPVPQVSDRRIQELLERSRASERAQRDLSRQLRAGSGNLQRAEVKYSKSQKWMQGRTSSRLPWSRRFLFGLCLGHVLLLLFFHRLSQSRAHTLFQTTYYDPFYPDLHLRPLKPDLLRHSLTTSSFIPRLSFSRLPDAVRQHGWLGAAEELRFNATAILWDWQRHAWDHWGTPQGTPATRWPPT